MHDNLLNLFHNMEFFMLFISEIYLTNYHAFFNFFIELILLLKFFSSLPISLIYLQIL